MVSWSMQNIAIAILFLAAIVLSSGVFVNEIVTEYEVEIEDKYAKTFGVLNDTVDQTAQISDFNNELEKSGAIGNFVDRVQQATVSPVFILKGMADFMGKMASDVVVTLGVPVQMYDMVISIVGIVVFISLAGLFWRQFSSI
ncbi:MAG: hypothetical protein CMI54_07740 [Parcubacteria group bacterium]|nr:hypothetical protein [Parcubacteria group bacterium]